MTSGGHHYGSTRVWGGLSRHSQNVSRVQTTASRATFGAWRSRTARPHNWRDAECHWNPIWHLKRSRRLPQAHYLIRHSKGPEQSSLPSRRVGLKFSPAAFLRLGAKVIHRIRLDSADACGQKSTFAQTRLGLW